MTVRITRSTSRVPPVPNSVDELVTDTSWIGRRDQIMCRLRRETLWTYGDTTRAARMATEQGDVR